MPRPVIHSRKHQKVVGPLTSVPGNVTNTILEGVDSLNPIRQEDECITGSTVKYLNVQTSFQNLTTTDAIFIVCSIQKIHNGQVCIDPYTTGGSPQRNQVFKTVSRCVAPLQNTNINMSFKIPKRFQRMRDGDKWCLTTNSNIATEELLWFITKVYE